MNADEQRLIRECLQGRTAAFGELVRCYQDRLFNMVYRLVDNADDAQDVLQETFIHAYQSLSQFKGNAQFYTWLYRIAVNAAISHRRRQRVVLSIHRGPEDGRDAHDAPDPSDFNQPGHALEQAEEERRIQEALNRLSPEHRAVLVLRDMEDEPYACAVKRRSPTVSMATLSAQVTRRLVRVLRCPIGLAAPGRGR